MKRARRTIGASVAATTFGLGLAHAQTGVSDGRVSLPEGPGSLEGVGDNARVDASSGSMSYRIPIDAPDGFEGVTPSLSLTYSSSAGSGVVGIGWDLAVPFIERMTNRGLPRYTGDDDWVANGGEQLVRVQDGDTATYRARYESGFVRYQWHERGAGSGGYWTAESPDGVVSYFGADHEGRTDEDARAQGAQGVFRYHLVEVVDPFGHIARYHYSNLGTVPYLDSIEYTFTGGVAQSRVTFEYEGVEGHVGRPATDPALLLALWLFATLDGVGSARALESLCVSHDAYRWLCGGVGVNRQTLSEFRVGHAAFLDQLLTKSVASLLNAGLVTMRRVAQDGMRTRASAGAASFRRRTRLQEFLAQAEAQVEALKEELNADSAASSRRRDAARQRAAAERLERVKKALAELEQVEAAKKKQEDKEKARVSTTDSEARVMKMADGGWRPAYNVQFVTDTKTMVVVGVDVTSMGSDLGQLAPMIEQLEERYGRRPSEALVDGGFTKQDDIERLTALGCTVYGPVMKPRGPNPRDPHLPMPDDSVAIAEWRTRMGTDAAKAIYKERAATAECVNAQARNRGLRQFLVRGLAKARSIALVYALAHNLQRCCALRAALP